MRSTTQPCILEAAYPWLLCEGIINIVEQVRFLLGALLVYFKEQMDATQITNFQRYIFDALPRAAKLRPTVPEYGDFFIVGLDPQNPSFTDLVCQGLPKRGANIFISTVGERG